MANFKQIFGLAGALVVFAGFANAQSTCTAAAAPVSVGIIRAEGTTELLPTLSITCTGAGAVGTASLQVFLNAPVTSKSIGGGVTEAQVSGGGIGTVQGAASGSTITFNGISLPAGTFTFSINNIRVNAASLGVTTGGVPQAISATTFISGSAGSINPAVISFSNIAYLEYGLAPAVISQTSGGSGGKSNNPLVCSSNSSGFLAFWVQVNENFPTAFKNAAGEASQIPVTGSSSSNAVADGTRVQIAFANVPANVSVYVPVAAITSAVGSDTLQLTNSAPGTAFAAVTAYSGGPSGLNALSVAPVSLSNGAGTATFELVGAADTNNNAKVNIPVYLVNSSFAVPAGSTTGITATVSLAPIGSTAIPNFTAASQTVLTGSVYNLCQTSLLFPFVTNQAGFDTGIAIANTSTDPLASGSTATPQSGTCTLNFYAGLSTPNPAPVTTASIGVNTTASPTQGSVYAMTLSSLAAGFQGYVVATCNFQYAHGFAFITDGVGTSGGLSQGYLAGVLPAARTATETLGF